MQQPENYYSLLGVTKTTTDLDIRQAYNLLVESLRAKTTADTRTQSEQRMQLLDTALDTLLNPEKRKRHDEKLDWHTAKSRIAAERAREADMRRKQAQEAALEREKAALVAEKQAADEALRKAAEEARRREELAQVEAKAAERFRQLREERLPFMDTDVPPLQVEEVVATQPAELTPVPAEQPADMRSYQQALAKKAAVGAAALVLLFAGVYLLLRPGSPHTAPPSPADMAQTAAPAASPAVPDPTAQAVSPSPALPAAADPAPQKPLTTTPAKPSKADSAKAAELAQYQKVLHRVEDEHPELNPDRPGHRADLMAFVAGRVNVHVKAGYPRAKALEIAVRDLETQEQTKHMLEKFRSSKEAPQAQAAPVLDKGEHQGYDPKCRWVTPEQWSCK